MEVPAPKPLDPFNTEKVWVPAGCNHVLDELRRAEQTLFNEATSRNNIFREALLDFEGSVISSINL